MRFTLSTIDTFVIFIYFTSIVLIGFYVSRKRVISNSKLDFLLAGRKLTTPLFVGTLVATWYGNILGVGEFVYKYGIVAWICFGVTYYIAAILYAFFVAGRIRSSENLTIPEQISKHYGDRNGLISSFIVLIITVPAAYILMLGILIQLFTGWELWICVVSGTVLSMVYLVKGGFRSDVITNVVQFVIMYLGFGAFVYFTISYYGLPNQMLEKIPLHHKDIFGEFSWMYILSWILIAFQTFVDPSFYQRCSAAKSPSVAKRGILISVSFWLLFDIMTLITGLYSRAFLPGIDPVMSYPLLSDQVLPVFWKGIFIITLLATIMSSLDSYAFLSAATIGNDILKKIRITQKYSVTSLTRFGLILTGAAGVALALILPSPIELIFRTASVAVPGLILPLLFTYSVKFKLKKNFVYVIMLTSSLVSLILYLLQSYSTGIYFLQGIEPMIGGMLVSIVLSLFGIKKSDRQITT